MAIKQMDIDDIVRTAIAFFANQKVTPAGIRAFINLMKPMAGMLDEEKLFLKIESMFNVTIEGSIITLEDSIGHEDWFNVSTNLPIKLQFSWHFWAHLKSYLISHKGRTQDMIENLDNLSSEILSRIEDP